MLQIRQLDEFFPKDSTTPRYYDKPLTPDIVFDSPESLFENLEKTLENLDERSKTNLFFTLHHQPDDTEARKKKVWAKQIGIMFDIDNVNDADLEKPEAYLEVMAKAIKVPTSSLVQVLSGHGYHFSIFLKNPIEKKEFFDTYRLHYQVLCANIEQELTNKGLSGSMDTQVFAPNYGMRLPFTLNSKKNRPSVWTKLLHKGLEPIDWDIVSASGLPVLDEKDYLSEKELSYFKIDSGSVADGCGFLKDSFTNQASLDEPTWYAMLSIVARLDDAEKLIHEYSKFHPSYNYEETKRKAEQAIQSSGPRTCDNIQKLWGGCKTCPHFKKIKSPIQIKGPNFIATEHTGFHMIGPRGALTPQYDDLERFYSKEHEYLNANKSHFIFTGTHWEMRDEVHIDAFAQEHFKPTCNNLKANEFRGLVKRLNLKTMDFFHKTTVKRINLENGIYNMDTMKLEEHSPEIGFRQSLPFKFDATAKCPEFDKHLNDVTLGREDLKETLLRFMAYCVAGDYPRAQKALILTGTGANGKSTFLEILSHFLGGDEFDSKNVSNQDIQGLSKEFGRYSLHQALVNISEEVPEFSEKTSWETLKALITGADVFASLKFKDAFRFRNKAKLVMTCNELPKGASPNKGFFRRLLIVPFEASFEKGLEDKFIASRICKNEMSGILNRVLGAWTRFVEADYTFPDSAVIRDAVEDLREEMDSVLAWSREELIFDLELMQRDLSVPYTKDTEGKTCIEVDELFSNYKEWCNDAGNKAVSRRKFSVRFLDHLRAHNLFDANYLEGSRGFHRVRIKGKKQRVVYGAGFQDTAEPEF
jgi:putative DNA primase/helicase